MKRSDMKTTTLQMVRRMVQLAFFILLPALYGTVFSGIRQIYLAVLHQSFEASLWLSIAEVAAVLPVTILFGRFFCGWMCAFGSYGDLIYRISSRIFPHKPKISRKADRLLKKMKYAILVFLVLLVWSFGVTAFHSASPWSVFGMLATVGKAPDFSYVLTNLFLGFLLFLAITAGSALVERFFCRYLCPLGALFAPISKLRIVKIKKPTEHCGSCSVCSRNCAMGIPLSETETVSSGECIQCMQCVSSCPRSNPELMLAKNSVRPLLAGAAAVTLMTGIYTVGTFSAKEFQNQIPISANQTGSSGSSSLSGSSTAHIYRDGTYQGTGMGFRGGKTVVSVTIQNDRITDITTVSYQDDDSFYNSAYSNVVNEILQSQSAQVDAVSGATFSSNGIMQAVANVLDQARN